MGHFPKIFGVAHPIRLITQAFIPGFIFITLMFIFPPAPTHAQSVTPIPYDQPLEGQISAEDFHNLYSFEGRLGEVITISMEVTAGDLDPYLALVDQSGQVVAISDDDGLGNAALIESMRLPGDGNFFIVATRFGQEQGATTGSYRLLLTRIGAAVPVGAVLQYGDEVFGTIEAEPYHAVYFFEAKRGDAISIYMQRTSGNLDPYLLLATEDRRILVEQDDDPSVVGTLNARIVNYLIPEDGVYIILASRYGRDAGTTSGRFELSLNITPESERGLAIYDAILLDYGTTIAGAITEEIPQRYYFFEAKRGDVIEVTMERTAGNLDQVLILLDSNNLPVLRIDPSGSPTTLQIEPFSLPADGTYYLMAARYDFSAGRTEGDFEITLQGRAGIVGSDFLEIFYGSQIEGEISDAVPFESYVFVGEAGDSINIRMETASGNLDPLLTLYQGNKQVAFNDDNGRGQNAAILNFRLPEDGIYRVEAARFNRADGTTTGGYILTLEGR